MNKTDDMVAVLKKLCETNKGITVVLREDEKKFISYKDLWNRSYYFSQWLHNHGVAEHSEVVVICENIEKFLYTFWACAIGRFIAMPLNITKNESTEGLLENVLQKADHPVIVSDTEISVNGDTEIIDINKLYHEILDCGDYTTAEFYTSPDDVLYVLYSSGTTGTPHGVAIKKSNVTENAYGVIKHYNIDEHDKFLSWLPLTHCYGLVTFHLTPLLAGADQCLFSTSLYMSQPLLWMDLIHEYKVTRFVSVPFALKHFTSIYRNTGKQFQWDLSAVKSMFIGAEQVNFSLFKEFCDITEQYGFTADKVYPQYGLTEATVIVTANKFGEKVNRFKVTNDKLTIGDKVEGQYIIDGNETDNTFLAVGAAIETIQLSIRDNDFGELGEGYLGQICVGGPCISSGYYKDEETTGKVFVDHKWLCTGDVGFIYRGHLYIIGREKELVVANGKKISCASIESIIQENLCNSKFEQCVVCNGIRHDNENEKVIVFIKTNLNSKSQNDIQEFLEFKNSLITMVFEKISLTISEVIPVEVIPKTTSGKVFRRGLAEKYNAGKFEELLDDMSKAITFVNQASPISKNVKCSKNMVSKAIISVVEQSINVNIKDYNISFSEYGIVSIMIPSFIKQLSDVFLIELDVSDFFKYFNVTKLTDRIYFLLNSQEHDAQLETSGAKMPQDKIAIVGMSCRLPGGADDVEAYWDLLYSGKDGICDVPEDRWELEKYYDKDVTAPGKMYCRKGGFLETDIEEFDARFFNISPKEAQELDPQQRMLLELTWEAFENANLDISKYSGSNTGVYLGMSINEYFMSHLYSGEFSRIGPYSLTGGCFSTACGRISYTFGFEGPSVSIDTACSSTLTALHMACMAMQEGDADLQVVAGINLIESPSINIGFSKLQATSIDGHSKSFDASANGYGRAEGGGVILLKRLSDAVRDKDEILGVIRATGINQDGKSNGLTAPNGEAQEKLIRKTLISAGLKAGDIDYLEMHGTGTPLGDPIEVHAVGEIYGKGRDKNHPLKIGSVKSNVGHLEAAAGISSIVKVLLSMKHDLIPANLHFHTPNPLINWDESNVEVVSKHMPWVKPNGLRTAAINGFGFGGSNAHVIIEEYKEEKAASVESQIQGGIDYVLKISAKSKTSLIELIRSYQTLLINRDDVDFQDIIYTANRTRMDLDFRFSVYGGSRQMIADRIASYLNGNHVEGVFTNMEEPVMNQKERKAVFMFTGQGSQYLNMGKLLYDTNPVFRHSFDECDKMFKPYILKSIVDLIYGENCDEQTIERTCYAQPLIFAIEYALYKLWENYGVKPEIVMGHSIGEYAAAVAAAMISLEDAVKLVSVRSRLMDMAPGKGSMAAIFADPEQTKKFLSGYEDNVCIAARNAKEMCVISGHAADVEQVVLRVRKVGITAKELKVSHGFHSMLMEPILEEFKTIAKEINYHAPEIRFVSSLYVREIESDEVLDSDYWTRHIRDEVDFYGAVTGIDKNENCLLMEVGSNRVLAASCQMIFDKDRVIAASLNIKKEDSTQLASDIALLYAAGINLDWNQIIFAGKSDWNKTKLPNYHYDKTKFRVELLYDRKAEAIDSTDFHKILGQKISLPHLDNNIIYQSKFTAKEPYFMREHIIFDTAISPAAAHLGMMIGMVEETTNPKSCTFREIEFRAPLAVGLDEERKVQLCIENKDGQFGIYSTAAESGDRWLLHAKGGVKSQNEYQFTDLRADIAEYQRRSYKTDMAERGVYYFMEQSGFELGEGFRGIKGISYVDEDCICMIEPLKTIPHLNEYVLYPGTIDSILQTGFAFLLEKMKDAEAFIGESSTIIPYYLEKFTYNYRASDRLWCHTKSYMKNQIIYVNIEVYNDLGEIVIKIDNLMAKLTGRDSLLRELKSLDKMYYHTEWIPLDKVEKPQEFSTDRKIIIISDDEQAASGIAQKLQGIGVLPVMELCNNKCKEKEDWSKLLQGICQGNKKQRLDILFYTAQKETDQLDVDYGAVKNLFTLVKTIDEEGYSQNSKIKIVTKDVQPFGNTRKINLSGSLVWGLSKVLSIEYPDIYGGITDCDQSVFEQDSDLIYEWMNMNLQDICIRSNITYGGKLIAHADYLKHTEKSDQKIRITAEGCYLITGGTGKVGLSYAEQLVRSGATQLLLLCRKEPGTEAVEVISRLRQAGVHIDVMFADVCDYESLKTALEVVKPSINPIRGVVHAAGILNDKMLADAEWADFETVINPKVQGCINLYHLLAEEPLDFFMMMSSITSVIGNMGQANYAAANYFMNIFASYLSLCNVPGYTFCWGPWDGGGMADDDGSISKNMERMGIKPFATGQAENIIADFMDHAFENLTIVNVDWADLYQALKDAAGKSEFLSKLISLEVSDEQNISDGQANEILGALSELAEEDRKEYLSGRIREICAKIMGFEKIHLLSPDEALMEQGADSLMTFSMRNAINKLLHIDLNISAFFNYPSITKLTEYLLAEVFAFENQLTEEESGGEDFDSTNDILMEIAQLTE